MKTTDEVVEIEIKNNKNTKIYFDIDDTVADLKGFLDSLEITKEILDDAELIFNKYYKNTGNSLEHIIRSTLFFKNYDTMYKHIKKLNNSIFNQINQTNLDISFLTFLPRKKKIEKFLDLLNTESTIGVNSIIDSFYKELKKEKIYWIRNILHSSSNILFASLDDGGKEKYANNNSYLIDNDENNINKFIKAGGHGILFDANKVYKIKLV